MSTTKPATGCEQVARKIVTDWLTVGTGARNACAIECVMLDMDREQLVQRIATALDTDFEQLAALREAAADALEMNIKLSETLLNLSRGARQCSNFAFNVGQHRDDWPATQAAVKRFDEADNVAHDLLPKAETTAAALRNALGLQDDPTRTSP